MSRTMKRTISALLAVIMVIALAFAVIPPVSASALSIIKYKITYTAKYAKLTLTPQSSSDTIYYTTNGTVPTTSSAKYSKTLAAGKAVVIRAAEYNSKGTKVASIKVTLRPRVANPELTWKTEADGATYITASTATAGASIYYTTNGKMPTTSSQLYSGKVRYTSGAVYVFRAFRTNWTSSEAVGYSDEDEKKENEDKEASASFKPTAEQSKVLELVNKERAKAGKKALVLDEGLCNAAAIRVKEITAKFAHVRPDGKKYSTVLDDLGIVNYASAENIAEGHLTPEEVMNGWMNSSGHKANILSDKYTHIGIALYEYNGRNYWVQVFGLFE